MVPRVNVIALWPCLIGVVIRNESKSHGILRTVSTVQHISDLFCYRWKGRGSGYVLLEVMGTMLK